MARVYGWMTIGLLCTALTALVVAGNPPLMKTLFTTGAFWVLVIAELGIAFVLSLALNKLPVIAAASLFVLYSVLTGATFSILLYVYTASSVAATFFVTAGMFGAMSVYGLVTRRSLDSLGSFMFMGLIGIVIASIVNIFLHSDAMSWLISFVGVIVFTGLTAYDTQKIKQSYAVGGSGTATNTKVALFGAFALYLEFINLFLMLLRFMGNRRD
ncbi:MAG: Bax inhibitor-1/YccA family protein [Phycisphaerae bacterium]